MFEQRTKKILLMPSIRSFELYTVVLATVEVVGPVSSFYWRDKRYPSGRGPYVSLWACMEDYKTLAPKRKGTADTPPTPQLAVVSSELRKPSVVMIDFILKKRL